jgi:ketosteroid isomerase-like protein
MYEKQAQKTFEAVGRKDLAAVMAGWADDGVLEFPGHSSLSGRYEGRAAIEGFFRRWFERMASIRITVRHVGFVNPLALNYTNTMYVEFETDQVTTDGQALHTEVVGVYRFRRRKLVSYREYLFDPSQAEAVWGPAVDPPTMPS